PRRTAKTPRPSRKAYPAPRGLLRHHHREVGRGPGGQPARHAAGPGRAGRLDRQLQRYKGKGGGTDLPQWLEGYYAGTVVVDRKTGDKPTLFIPRAAVSVTGTITPGMLARMLSPDYLEAGLGARLLMGWPPRRRKVWTEARCRSGSRGVLPPRPG